MIAISQHACGTRFNGGSLTCQIPIVCRLIYTDAILKPKGIHGFLISLPALGSKRFRTGDELQRSFSKVGIDITNVTAVNGAFLCVQRSVGRVVIGTVGICEPILPCFQLNLGVIGIGLGIE